MNIMSKEKHGWERIALILEEQNISAAALARMIGLPDPRTLYRIKKRNTRIPHRLASAINRIMPEYNIEWLLTGSITLTVDIRLDNSEPHTQTLTHRISKHILCKAHVSQTVRRV